jgi:DNA-directed RNA polymerase I subunit RPA2
MKTTLPRKLLPESWGFLCPVHTPDGSPCGLLNHLTRDVVILSFPTTSKLPTTAIGNFYDSFENYTAGNLIRNEKSSSNQSSSLIHHEWIHGLPFKRLLISLGVTPSGIGGQDGKAILSNEYIVVMLDGVVIGGIHFTMAEKLVNQLRILKNSTQSICIDPTMEITYMPYTEAKNNAYPGSFF